MTTIRADQIEAAFKELNTKLEERNVRAECYLVGGAVMCLALHARESTRDVDAWFTEPQAVREASREVAGDLGLPEDWLNDAAKAFIPQGATFERWRSYSHLELCVADPRTLLAMKCAAARTEEDRRDIAFLIKHLNLLRADDVLTVVREFYPAERLPVRTQLLIEELFDDCS